LYLSASYACQETQLSNESSCFTSRISLETLLKKRRENGENGENESYFGASTHGSQLGRALNWADGLRTSADEQVLSGHRAVVIV